MMNPRFPHRCKIKRIFDNGPFEDESEETLYSGECRKYSGYRMTEPDGVEKEIFALSVPSMVKARAGDIVEIEDYVGTWHGRIKSCAVKNLGTTIHWEDVKR